MKRLPKNQYINQKWSKFWMRFASSGRFGRQAMRVAAWFTPPHYKRIRLAYLHPDGYIAYSATLHHSKLYIGKNVFIDEHCLIYQRESGGKTELGDKVCIYRGTILETGNNGRITIANGASLHPGCRLMSYFAPIDIGEGVMIAANCSIFSYDHEIMPGIPIRDQALTSKGKVTIGDEAWIGTGCIILSGVRIGSGAVIGAGSVVTKDVPDGAIAVGNPARVVKMRADLVVNE